MSNLTIQQATSLYNIANASLIFGSALVLMGTIAVIWTSSILDRYMDERISTNEADTERAKADAAQANLKTAELERQNLELRQKFANRRITKEQHDILVMELSKNPTTFNMKVMSDPESGFYAEDILRTLKSAGWQVESKTLPIGELWEGLVLSFHTDDPAMPQLAEAFKKANIPFTYGNEKSPKVTIIVGGKPPAF